MNAKRHPLGNASGQAMVELVVGLVVILVFFVGLLGAMSITKQHTDLMTKARESAGVNAVRDYGGDPIAMDAGYIRNWGVGRWNNYTRTWGDERRHTADDYIETDGDANRFSEDIVAKAGRSGDWDLLDVDIPNNRISALRNQYRSTPEVFFGLVLGEAGTEIDLTSPDFSLFRRLIQVRVEDPGEPKGYKWITLPEELQLRSKVWLTWTKGIY